MLDSRLPKQNGIPPLKELENGKEKIEKDLVT